LSGSVVGEDSSLHFTLFCSRFIGNQFAAMCKRAKEKTCADRLLPRNLSSFSRDRHCVLPRLAFVRVELLLNSRLPQLARVCRELRIAGFTNSARRDVADSFCNPKTALCHNSVSHSAGNCASLVPNRQQAAEKEVEGAKKLTSGAEARTHFQRLTGTTEVVPFPNPARTIGFRQGQTGRSPSLH